jgi:elongation factor P
MGTRDIAEGMYIKFEGDPYVCIAREFYAPAKGSSFNRVKLKNLRTGKIINQTWRSAENIEEISVETKNVQFLYNDDKQGYFMDPVSFEQFSFPLDSITGGTNYLHADGKYIVVIYEGKVLSVQPPVKMTLKVVQADEAVKGNTATNTTKEAVLETGAKVQVPLFISVGDSVTINTELNTYVSKA